jgi:probable rRNA maturation factor
MATGHLATGTRVRPAAAMPVDVQIATDTDTPDAAALETWAEAALERGAATAVGAWELCVRVVDEMESQHLNQTFRQQDSPTNVLSFPADIDLPEARLWGDVVICAPVVRREADTQGKAYDDHFAHMVVHGVLHLLGYDHQSTDQAVAMEDLEKQILDSFGISDPYGEG